MNIGHSELLNSKGPLNLVIEFGCSNTLMEVSHSPRRDFSISKYAYCEDGLDLQYLANYNDLMAWDQCLNVRYLKGKTESIKILGYRIRPLFNLARRRRINYRYSNSFMGDYTSSMRKVIASHVLF